jgi:hypothetical protein
VNEDNELINLEVFVALRLEPVPDGDNLFCLVGVLGGSDGNDGGGGDEEDGPDGDEAFVQLSPPLPKAAAEGCSTP